MKKMSSLIQLLIAATLASGSASALAHSTAKNEDLQSYVVSTDGKVVKTGFGDCLRTSSFDAKKATEECDPDLIPKKPAPVAVPMAPTPTPVPAPVPVPAPAPKVTKVTLEADAFFAFDKAELKPAGKTRIDEELKKLGNASVDAVVVIGHTDSVGADAYNQKLSERRANVVKTYLVSKGIPADKIQSKGMGESQPRASNKTKDGRAKNRYVEIDFNITQK